MFTVESVKMRLEMLGIDGFLDWVLNNEFSEESILQLEKLHIIKHGYPCLSAINRLAAL